MDHIVQRIRAQHGPKATCGTARCGRSVTWNVMADEWQHNLTVAQDVARQEQTARDMADFMTELRLRLIAASFPESELDSWKLPK